jgi:hypothetical protein
MRLEGANPSPEVRGLEELAGKSNYFFGKDSNQWHTNVTTFAKVRYHNVYPGIDLVYYGNQQQLEHDFIVTPRADPKAIQLKIEGTKKIRLDSGGNLVMQVPGGEVRLRKPLLYQEAAGERREIAGEYKLERTNLIGFRVARYDETRPLIIDPVLVYSTYFGGTSQDNGDGGIAVDSSGNVYVSGLTDSSDFPTTSGAYQTNFRGFRDIFVTKLNPTGSAVVYSTYLGGSGGEDGGNVAVDSAGNLYVAGQTNSSDFPTVNALQSSYGGGASDGVVTKIDPTGSALIYSTYLGGSGEDHPLGIAVDGSGNAYVAGNTQSSDFPTTFGAFQTVFGGGGGHVFVSKFNASGSALLYSTFFGGNGSDSSAHGIGVDSSGNVHVAGGTNSTNFPTVNAFQNAFGGGGGDGFIATLNAAGSGLVYSTYIGGSGDDSLNALASDSNGNACVTGTTTSSNFPTTSGAYQTALAGGSYDAVVAKLNPAGSPVYSTYLGGSNYDFGIGVALDGAGNTYVAGQTYSSDFPTTNAFQSTFGGTYDGFVTELNPSGSALIYSSYLGGSGGDAAQAVAVKSVGEAYVSGTTGSTDFPTANPFQTGNAGSLDLFIAKIGSVSKDFFLHGSGGLANPPTLYLDNTAPSATIEAYKDSSAVNFSGGNPWKQIGTWSASSSLTNGTLTSLSDLHVWLGLKNSDDQGTRFDLRAEVLKNGTPVASGETLCIQGITRNANLAKEVIASFGAFSAVAFDGSTDGLSMRVLTRVGTNGAGVFCGGHSNATGLRLYFDAVSRPARFDATF